MPTALSVNLNKLALLRNSRGNSAAPNLIEFALMAIEAGANGITVHPRPDQRHIRPNDVIELAQLCRQYSAIEFNVEGNPFALPQAGKDQDYPGFMDLVEAAKPDQVTLVPDGEGQLTSDHGFDVIADGEKLKPVIERLHTCGLRVSLFMDPDIKQIQATKTIGADRIELYTEPYAANFSSDRHSETLKCYRDAAMFATTEGLIVNAGHDLNLDNLQEFLAIGCIAEVSIGHALTIEALRLGYKNTIAAYRKICQVDYTSIK